MFITTDIHPRRVLNQLSHLVLCFALVTCAAHSQEKQSLPERRPYAVDVANVPDAIAKVKSGDFAAVHVDLIARAGAVDAIPILKQQFSRVQDPFLKAKIAGALIRMGDKDDTYWDFLVEFATPALESDAPDFMNHDSQGKSLTGPSPEFLAWAKAHNVSPDSAGADYVYLLPAKIALLGWSRDARAVPLLRQGLASPNDMIKMAAALGLAEIGDKASIPLIINACRQTPREAASAIAQSLVYFDDPEAQNAVDEFIPRDLAKMYRDARANGKKTPMDVPLN